MPGLSSWSWARQLLPRAPHPGPDREKLPPRLGDPDHVPVSLPYIRGERTPFEDHTLRSNIYGLDIGSGAEAIERAAFEASRFVVQRMLDMADVRGKRIVASGGGSRVTAWMAAVADATGLPVETVAMPEGAARGAAYFARMAARLETRSRVQPTGRPWVAGSSPIPSGPAPPPSATAASVGSAPGCTSSAVRRKGHFECAAAILAGDCLEGRPLLFEGKAMGQHGRDVQAAIATKSR